MRKRNRIIRVIWLSVFIMFFGFILIFFGYDYGLIAGAILIGAGLITIGRMAIELNAISNESEDDAERSKYQKELTLRDGNVLQIIKDFGFRGGTEVRINDEIPKDGFYILSDQALAYKVSDGKIAMEYYLEKFKQEDGSEIEIGGNRINGIAKNSPVWINGNLVPDGAYKKGRKNILVINGLIE